MIRAIIFAVALAFAAGTAHADDACILTVLVDPDAPDAVARARCEYDLRQAMIYCANHPDKCFRPKSELEKARLDYIERQRRIKK